jgi:hypothetical protein
MSGETRFSLDFLRVFWGDPQCAAPSAELKILTEPDSARNARRRAHVNAVPATPEILRTLFCIECTKSLESGDKSWRVFRWIRRYP